MSTKTLFDERLKGISQEIIDDVDDSIDIATRICEILKLKNLSHRDLADKLHKSESEISKWLSGLHNFTWKTLMRIQRVLGEPIVQVVNEEILRNQDLAKNFNFITSKLIEINKLKSASSRSMRNIETGDEMLRKDDFFWVPVKKIENNELRN